LGVVWFPPIEEQFDSRVEGDRRRSPAADRVLMELYETGELILLGRWLLPSRIAIVLKNPRATRISIP
jgi:hypothetical protein